MKRIYGITAVEERAKPEKGVKVQLFFTLPRLVLEFNIHFSLNLN